MELRERRIYKVTLIGSVVNAALIVIKLIAGIAGRSSALVADGVHSLTDFISDVIVLIFVKIAGKPSDKGHDYGHGKFETLATLIIGLILLLAGVGLGVEGISQIVRSLRGEVLAEPSWIALAVALVSILVKEILYRYTVRWGKKLDSDAVKANAWHHRSDAISSFGTAVGIAGAIFLGQKYRILDPIAAAVVSVFIVKSGYDIMKPCISELLESSLPDSQVKELEKIIMSTPGVRGFHRLRTRKVGNAKAIDLHIKLDGNLRLTEAHNIASAVEAGIKRRFGKNSIINIHMEPWHESRNTLKN
ncbi:MAG: cation diffusion facilitator family transporter [Muribaculaceae bacterium]|nr:cation diffusion facilitator family transporter [Muribaculaceae bacterium]